MSDIRTQFALRWPLCRVDYYPVLVQGDGAAEDIIRNLRKVDDQGYDAVILSRGGGSFEHLFCFNDESLVRAIVSMKTFIITGIGHEQDFTLADFAADVRCPTPTAAAVYLTPTLDEVSEEILEMEETLEECVTSLLEEHAEQLNRFLSSKAFRDPYSLIQHEELTLDYLQERMLRYTENFRRLSERIDLLTEKRNHAAKRMKENSLHALEKSLESLHLHIGHRLQIESLRVKRCTTLIEAYSREKVLERGFSLVYKEGRLVASKTALEKDDDITVVLKDGSFTATVKEV